MHIKMDCPIGNSHYLWLGGESTGEKMARYVKFTVFENITICI
jgi:hypothetical protein